MDTIALENSFEVSCLKAASFPEGVLEAHEQLKSILPTNAERTFYGISRPGRDGSIIYMAAANNPENKGVQATALEKFTISRGSWLVIVIKDWMNNISSIQEAFETLISDPRIDRNGYCLEEYVNEDTMRCMVPLAEDEYAPGTGTAELIWEIEETYKKLNRALSVFREEQIDTIPFEGSWTAGQVTEHIIKTTSGIPDKHTRLPQRFQDQKVLPVQELFLNFNMKFEADPSLQPESSTHDKKALLKTLQEIEARHRHTVSTTDLSPLCLDMELPTFGYLTRYEWLRFILFHTQRHTRQLESIYERLTA